MTSPSEVEDARSDRDGRTHHANCYTQRGHHDCAIAEVNRVRAKNAELNRRCSQLERGVAAKVEEMQRAGPSLGRGLANAAATLYHGRVDLARHIASTLPPSRERDDILTALDLKATPDEQAEMRARVFRGS